MIKAIVFDCFGVLIGRGFRDTYAAAGGDPGKDAAFIEEMLGKANAALISPDTFNEAVADRLGISVEEWLAVVARQELSNTALFEYIRTQLKPKYKIGLLSNANKGSLDLRFTPEQRALFDAFVVSGEVGHVKPEREIYQLVADQLGVSLGEMVFIDDLQPYVAAAKSCGIPALLYRDLQELKHQLTALLAP